MKTLLFAIVLSLTTLCASAKVIASLEFPGEGVVLLHDTLCPNSELMVLEVQNMSAQTVATGCWMIMDDQVVTAMEDGRVITTPAKAFKGNKWSKES